mgnify:CR=1 FL=1|jgi:hypothetical protein
MEVIVVILIIMILTIIMVLLGWVLLGCLYCCKNENILLADDEIINEILTRNEKTLYT